MQGIVYLDINIQQHEMTLVHIPGYWNTVVLFFIFLFMTGLAIHKNHIRRYWARTYSLSMYRYLVRSVVDCLWRNPRQVPTFPSWTSPFNNATSLPASITPLILLFASICSSCLLNPLQSRACWAQLPLGTLVMQLNNLSHISSSTACLTMGLHLPLALRFSQKILKTLTAFTVVEGGGFHGSCYAGDSSSHPSGGGESGHTVQGGDADSHLYKLKNLC